MIPRLILLLIATLFAATEIGQVAAQQHEPRIALIIGNAAYPDASQLKDPINNAHALTDELRRHGFDVDIGENLTKEAMGAALGHFYGKIKPGSTALFFFQRLRHSIGSADVPNTAQCADLDRASRTARRI
jgi:hypothetical protein